VPRVVVDPGVFVSALIAPKGTPAQLLDLLLEQRFELIVSPRLLGELTGVLLRDRFRRYVTAAEVRELLADLAAVAIVLRDPPDPAAVTRDPDDDYLIALAVAAQADALISGDHDLTDLEDPPVPVLTPRAFLDRLGGLPEG
jgi:putative PIN family toxin of toxin-antitoxin system